MPYSLPPDSKPARLNPENVPLELRTFISFAEQFGICDDNYRDELLFGLDKNELEVFIQAFHEMPLEILEEWLGGEESKLLNPSHEYATFRCLMLSYHMARIRLVNLN